MAAPSVRRFSSILYAAGFLHKAPKVVSASASVQPDTHGGRTTALDAAAGLTITLPASSGSGNRYRFVIKTTAATGDYVIQVANTTDVMKGGVFINDTGDSAAATADFWPTASTSDTLTMNHSVGEGKAGDWFEVEDLASGVWAVHGVMQGATDPATPFSAAV